MTATDVPALNAAVNRLMGMLAAKQDELRRRESSCDTYRDVRKMCCLRAEIEALDARLARAERLQDAALASGGRP